MVLIHVKQSEERQFLYDGPSSQSLDPLIRDLVSLHNLQLKILHLSQHGQQLLLYGPSKPPHHDDHPDDDDHDSDHDLPESSRGPFYRKDPARKRTGQACDPGVAETLRKELSEAVTCVSKEQVLHKVPLNAAMLKEAVQNVKGAVMICYPMGLQNYDPVHQLLIGTYQDNEVMDADTAQLWWAGKELMRGKRLSDHVGKNEKTKIVAKLQVRGKAPPPREPPIDAETQKAMMSWYYRQQQEQKKLEEDEDDSFTNSKWADPRALKCHFQGTSAIRYR